MMDAQTEQLSGMRPQYVGRLRSNPVPVVDVVQPFPKPAARESSSPLDDYRLARSTGYPIPGDSGIQRDAQRAICGCPDPECKGRKA